MTDLDKLEAIAKAATPGPWEYETDSDDHSGGIWIAFNGPNLSASWNDEEAWRQMSADATHIATFDPPTVLRLIAVARAAKDWFAVSYTFHDAEAAVVERLSNALADLGKETPT